MKKTYGFIAFLLILGFHGFAQTSLVSNLNQAIGRTCGTDNLS